MTAPERIVRNLRLRAGSEEQIGRVLPRLEDALRCASLPDAGSRLLLVRKLELGRFDGRTSAQALSRLIEQRMARAGVQWVAGDTAEADNAEFVSFTGALQARTHLALRLIRGEPCSSWYWPLAVPELRPHADRGQLLRRIAQTIAQLPEARTGLPAWAAALVAAGGATQLMAAIDATLGESVLRQAGIAMESGTDEPDPLPAAPHTSRGFWQVRRARLASPNGTGLPRWLRILLIAAGYSGRAGLVTRDTSPMQPTTVSREVFLKVSRSAVAGEAARPAAGASAVAGLLAADEPASLDTRFMGMPTTSPAQRALNAPPTSFVRPEPVERSQATVSATPHLYLEPTACAGLLFLLPVLTRLGIAAWSEQAGGRGERFAHRVLMAALERLGVEPEDPVWTLIPTERGDSDPLAVPPPASWRDALLRAPRSRRYGGGLSDALQCAGSLDAQAALWLQAARRWLRRGAHIGLATLVLRAGFVSVTPTHVDIHFRVDDTDLRVRRAGLDLNPGWLPWYGRVVGFHYSERAA